MTTTDPADMTDDELADLIERLERERLTRKRRTLIATELQEHAEKLFADNADVLTKPWVNAETGVEGCAECIHVPLSQSTDQDEDAVHHTDGSTHHDA